MSLWSRSIALPGRLSQACGRVARHDALVDAARGEPARPASNRTPRATSTSTACLVASFLVAVGAACEKPEKVVAAPPPPEVNVATVLQRDVPVYVEAIGETRGNTEIEIRARVEGFIETVDFKEGSLVEKGQLLYTIDPRPFETKLAQTNAAQAETEAQLARAHQDVARYEPLVAKNAISREEYETAVQLEKAAAAAVEAAKAIVESAKLDLSYCRVIAPDAGLVGRTEVYAGTLVGRGLSTLLTHISRTDPIHVRFSLPEREYLAFARKHGTGNSPDKGKGMKFELLLPDGTVLPQPGELVFVDRNVDARTGTIMGEAGFPNPGQILRPGQYVRVRARVEERKGAILVPQRAVQEMQGVFSVMVLGSGDTVEQRIVTPGEREGKFWVIPSGLKPSEKVIVDGLQKVRPGVKVAPKTVLLDDKEDKDEAASSAADAPDAAPAKDGSATPPAKHE